MSRIDAPVEGLNPAERSEEARTSLLAAAAGSERRNRPVYLVAIASLLLLACAISLGWSLWVLGAASREFGRERGAATALAQSVGRLKELEAAQGGGEKGPPANDRILTMLQAAAEKAGIANSKGLIPRQGAPETRAGGVQRVKFDYDAVRDPSLEPLLLWLKHAGEDVPGIEVYSVNLRPEANGWLMKVVFQRWQRAGP